MDDSEQLVAHKLRQDTCFRLVPSTGDMVSENVGVPLKGPGFWTQLQAQRGLSDNQLKSAVMKDQETIALVGALVMTITFAVHVTDDALTESSRYVRFAYLLATGCSASLSMAGTIVAVRTVIMLTINNAADAPVLLDHVSRQRVHWRFHSFNLVKWSFFSLFIPQSIIVLVSYEWLEATAYILPLVFAIAFCHYEDNSHAFAYENTRMGCPPGSSRS